MPHQETPEGDPPLIHLEISHLPVHLFHCLAGHLGVIPGTAELQSHTGIGIFEIGHVEIKDSIQQLQSLQRIVSSRVVHQRHL